MQPTSTNGSQTWARDVLDSLRLASENLEAELARQPQENKQLREERDDYRGLIMEQLKKQLSAPKEWDNFDESEFTLTIDDLLPTLR